MLIDQHLQVGDRFLVVSIISRFYGQKGKILRKPSKNGIVSVHLDDTDTVAQRVSIYHLQKI